MSAWYNKYVGIPFKHLGEDRQGIDCYNLCRLILREERNILLPASSMHFCNIVDEDWYNKISVSPFEEQVKLELAAGNCKKVTIPSAFDIIVMSIGATNITNHCATYIGNNKIIHTMLERPSWISSYGSYYKQYTTGIYRWTSLKH